MENTKRQPHKDKRLSINPNTYRKFLSQQLSFIHKQINAKTLFLVGCFNVDLYKY